MTVAVIIDLLSTVASGETDPPILDECTSLPYSQDARNGL